MMRVLIASGGPGHTQIAIRQLTIMAETLTMTPTVLTVIKDPSQKAEADAILAHAAELLDPVFDQVTYKTRVGQPAEEIVAESESGRYDLLMMGQRTSRPLMTRLRGPVTQKVVSQATLPVLIAKREARPFERVLICDSGVQSPTLLQVFRLHAPAILASTTDVTILHVMSQISAAPGIRGPELRAEAVELIEANTPEGVLLAQDMAYLREMDLRPQALVRHGLVVDEIIAEASTGDYDLVVIGAHRDEGLPRFLLDDLARELVLNVECATLVVR
jgi:nucleotide-binding universal stress UspA family protein